MNNKHNHIAISLLIFLLSLFILFNLLANYRVLGTTIGLKNQTMFLMKEIKDRKTEIKFLYDRQEKIIKILEILGRAIK